jgi:hypothetical protein
VPIIQFLEEEGQELGVVEAGRVQLTIDHTVLEHMQQIPDVNRGDKGVVGPTPSDMIPALRGLSSLQVSFGSASDVVMTPGGHNSR